MPCSFLSRDGTQLKEVDDCNKLHIIWQSNISRKTKLDFFRACVESILLHGSETWTVKKDLQDRLDGTYTRLLMRAQNISWREHKTKAEIYDVIPQTSSILAQRRARFATAIDPKTK